MRRTRWWWAGVAMIVLGLVFFVAAGMVQARELSEMTGERYRLVGIQRDYAKLGDEWRRKADVTKGPISEPSVGVAVGRVLSGLPNYLLAIILGPAGVLILHRESIHLREQCSRGTEQ